MGSCQKTFYIVYKICRQVERVVWRYKRRPRNFYVDILHSGDSAFGRRVDYEFHPFELRKNIEKIGGKCTEKNVKVKSVSFIIPVYSLKNFLSKDLICQPDCVICDLDILPFDKPYRI